MLEMGDKLCSQSLLLQNQELAAMCNYIEVS